MFLTARALTSTVSAASTMEPLSRYALVRLRMMPTSTPPARPTVPPAMAPAAASTVVSSVAETLTHCELPAAVVSVFTLLPRDEGLGRGGDLFHCHAAGQAVGRAAGRTQAQNEDRLGGIGLHRQAVNAAIRAQTARGYGPWRHKHGVG